MMLASNKNHIRVFVAWLLTFAIVHFLSTPNQQSISRLTAAPQSVDAVAFIAMSKMAAEPMVDHAVISIRKLGKYRGKIFVVTDQSDCFSDLRKSFDVTIISVAPVHSILEIKSLKPKIFTLLPADIESVLYLDIDILIRKNLNSFLRDFPTWTKKLGVGNHTVGDEFDMASFLDSKGHYGIKSHFEISSSH